MASRRRASRASRRVLRWRGREKPAQGQEGGEKVDARHRRQYQRKQACGDAKVMIDTIGKPRLNWFDFLTTLDKSKFFQGVLKSVTFSVETKLKIVDDNSPVYFSDACTNHRIARLSPATHFTTNINRVEMEVHSSGITNVTRPKTSGPCSGIRSIRNKPGHSIPADHHPQSLCRPRQQYPIIQGLTYPILEFLSSRRHIPLQPCFLFLPSLARAWVPHPCSRRLQTSCGRPPFIPCKPCRRHRLRHLALKIFAPLVQIKICYYESWQLFYHLPLKFLYNKLKYIQSVLWPSNYLPGWKIWSSLCILT